MAKCVNCGKEIRGWYGFGLAPRCPECRQLEELKKQRNELKRQRDEAIERGTQEKRERNQMGGVKYLPFEINY